MQEIDIGCHVLELYSLTTGANSVILPKTNDNSLRLTGRYVYILLRPVEDKGFLLHLDIHASDGLDVRITLSNVFTELKLTNLSLHLPFDIQSKGQCGTEWTLLRLDLNTLFSVYHGRKHQWISRLQLSSSMQILGILVSDISYSIFENKTESIERKSRKPLRFPLFRGTIFETNNQFSVANQPVVVRFPEDLDPGVRSKCKLSQVFLTRLFKSGAYNSQRMLTVICTNSIKT